MSSPFLSVLLDPRESTADAVRTTVATVLAQSDAGWELLLAAPTDGVVMDDISVRRGGLADARGEFVTRLDPGGRLDDRAVATLRAAVEAGTEVDLVYCNEQRVGVDGGVVDLRKPVWSPARLRSQPWTGRLTLVRRDLAVAGADADGVEVDGHDLVLRVAEHARSVVRVPEFLWTDVDHPWTDTSWDRLVEAVAADLSRTGTPAQASRGHQPGTCRLDWTLPRDLTVAVVVPVDARRGLAWGERRQHAVEAARSVLDRAGHPVQLVVVHTPEVTQGVLDELWTLAGTALTLVPFGAAFDWAAMVNKGVLATEADAVLILDQECEIGTPDLVADLVGPLADETVGLVGPRVLRSDRSLLNAGLAWFEGHVVDAFAGLPEGSPQLAGEDLVHTTRECSALSGHCVAVRRATFDEVGGLSESLPGVADVDLSLKVARLGQRRQWVPHATVYHLGSAAPRQPAGPALTELRRRWPSPAVDDYVPHLGARRAEQAAADLAALMG